MNRYLFVMALIFFIITIIIQQTIAYKRSNRAIAQSIKGLNGLGMFSSIIWFFLAFSYFMMFIKYEINDIGISPDFDKLYIAILYTLVGLSWMLRSLRKDIIYEYGVCTLDGNYKWNRIVSYKWGLKNCRNSKKGSIEYYNLVFNLNRRKVAKWFSSEEYKEIILEIDINDKERIEEFLKEKCVYSLN